MKIKKVVQTDIAPSTEDYCEFKFSTDSHKYIKIGPAVYFNHICTHRRVVKIKRNTIITHELDRYS